MLVVRSVDVLKVEDDKCVIMKYDENACGVLGEDSDLLPVVVRVDEIQGKRYNVPGLGSYIIGWSVDVYNALGIPFYFIDELRKEVKDLTTRNDYLFKRSEKLDYEREKTERKHKFALDKLNNYETMNFVDRLRFLFLGRKMFK